MNKEKNIDIIWPILEAFRTGAAEGIIKIADCLVDDVTWVNPDHQSDAPGIKDKNGVLDFFKTMGSSFSANQFITQDFYSDEDTDTIIVKGFTNKTDNSGKGVESNWP